MLRRPGLAICLLGLCLAVAGCSRDGSSSEPDGSSIGARTTPPSGQPQGPPLGFAKAKENAKEASTRIAKAIASGNCKRINQLTPVTRTKSRTAARCKFLRTRLGHEVTGVNDLGPAAVIDYAFGPNGASALLVRDADGRFHVDNVDLLLPGSGTGGKTSHAASTTAKKAIAALQSGDCKELAALAHYRLGLGLRSHKEICAYAKQNPVAPLIKSYPDARLKLAGGNSDYAFFSLASPALTLLAVVAKQADPPSLPDRFNPLPKSAPSFGLVDVVLVNRRG